MRLENLEATDEVRLIRVSGGQPTDVIGPVESFNSVATRVQQAWIEGVLHAEIELERQADVPPPNGCAGVFSGMRPSSCHGIPETSPTC